MTATAEAVIVSVLLALLIYAALSKPKKKAIVGWISKGKTGLTTLVFGPPKKSKRKKRR